MMQNCTFFAGVKIEVVCRTVAQQKRPAAFSGSGWKVSLKRVDEKIRLEEQRVGLA